MKRHLRRTGVRVVLVVVSAFGAVLWTVDAVWSMQEPKEVAYMSKQMKTVCVGRFLIDVPVNARIAIGSTSVDGFNVINYGKETQKAFQERLRQRENEIRAETNRAGMNNLESTQEIHDGAVQGKVFVFNRKSSHYFLNGERIPTLTVSVNGYAYVDGMSLGFIASVYKPEDVGGLTRLLAQLEPMEEGAFPRKPGFCLDRVFLRDPLTADQGERIVMFAGLPGHEDLGIALSTIAGSPPGPGLLERHRDNRTGSFAILDVLFSTLLEGKRTIHGLEGEEFAVKARERNFTTGYAFDWETPGTQDNVLHPFVSLELQTGLSAHAGGEPVQSTLSEASLGDLWRRMSSSLRLRPVEQAAAMQEGDPQPGMAIGTVAWAGAPCRQSGWWECGDANGHIGVFGGERQFLREGAVMPQALLLPKPSVWQKVRGLQPSYETTTPTRWRLADKRAQGRRHADVALRQPPASLAPADDAVSAAPGRVARSGETCPASGWWRCLDAQALDETRWFARGAALPLATYRLTGGATERRGANDQLIVREAGWQLMRVGAPDPQSVGQGVAGASAPA